MIWERFLCKSAVFGAIAALLLGFAGQEAIAENATYVGEKVCATCHDAQNKRFGHTLHAKVFRENPKNDAEKQVCEACHGPGSLHTTNPTDHSNLIGFTKEWGTPIETQNAQCLTCHKGGQRSRWPGSVHEVNKLGCSDCHNPMAKASASGSLKKASITDTCQTCHQQQRADFKKISHMPVPEGKMSCEDCHNPHGSITSPLLKAVSVNELCYTCHAEKRGPLIWEHAPVRENCLNCHYPHGSNNEKLLTQARPYLCLQCHDGTVGHMATLYQAANTANNVAINPTTGLPANVGAGAFSARMVGRTCQNCHVMIHGSNHPSGERFQR